MTLEAPPAGRTPAAARPTTRRASMSRIRWVTATTLLAVSFLLLHGLTDPTYAQKEKKKKATEVWTDAEDPTLPADFKFQGEYAATIGASKAGCQVIALGKGHFQAVVYPGGLPGDGWDGKNKSLMDGKLNGETVSFEPAKGKKKYLAQKPE